MRHLIPAAVVVALALAGEAASAATIVVAPGGSDAAGTGNLASPLGSLQAALARSRPGDLIQLRGGTYRQAGTGGPWIGPERSGTPDAPLRIEAYPGEAPELVGSPDDCLTLGADWVEIRGITCRDAARTGIAIWGGSHDKIVGNRVLGAGYTGIGAFVSEVGPAADNLIEGNEVAGAVASNQSPERRAGPGGWSSAIGSGGARTVVRGNRVHHNWGEGIVLSGDDGVVSGNVLVTSFSVAVYLDGASRALVERNLIVERGESGFLRSLDGGRTWRRAAGIQFGNEQRPAAEGPLSDLTVRNNIVVGAGQGIIYGDYMAGGGLHRATIVNNTVVDPTIVGFHLDAAAHEAVAVANNVFLRRDRGPLVFAWDIAGVRFEHNAWSGSAVGLAAGPGDERRSPLLRGGPPRDPASHMPRRNSPLIDRASRELAPPDDYAAAARTAGFAPDIGAFEVR